MTNNNCGMPSRSAIAERLVAIGYTAIAADDVAGHVLGMDPDLRDAFCSWWNTGITPDVLVEGHDVTMVMKGTKVASIPEAMAIMQWLRADPEYATRRIKSGFRDYIVDG